MIFSYWFINSSIDSFLYYLNRKKRPKVISSLCQGQSHLITWCRYSKLDDFFLGNWSTLEVIFHLKRNSAFYLIQVLGPTILTVSISWISFIIKFDQHPARISLGITSILTMEAIHLFVQTSLPKVRVFLSIIILFVFIDIFDGGETNIWRACYSHTRSSITKISQTDTFQKVDQKAGFNNSIHNWSDPQMMLKSSYHLANLTVTPKSIKILKHLKQVLNLPKYHKNEYKV